MVQALSVRQIEWIHPIEMPPPLLRILMYLKCLLHNLCSINNCFKGCDTTSAHCFSWFFYATCFSPNRAAFMYVCIAVSPVTFNQEQPIPWQSHKELSVVCQWENKMCSPDHSMRKIGYNLIIREAGQERTRKKVVLVRSYHTVNDITEVQ